MNSVEYSLLGKIREKFFDKGYVYEFHMLVPQPLYLLDPSCYDLMYRTREQIFEQYKKVTVEVYGKEWDYWNTWIDYQLPKF